MTFPSSLIDDVRAACMAFPDARPRDVRDSMADIGLSAFSPFLVQSGSLLPDQRSLEEGRKTSNCRTLFGMAAVPTDDHIRAMLDPVHPVHLQPAFDGVVTAMHRRDGFAPFRRLGDRVLIAPDGTEYLCSQKLDCPRRLTGKRCNGKVEGFRSMLYAMIVSQAMRWSLAPMLEFIALQDGAEKQDRERNAVRRWGARGTNEIDAVAVTRPKVRGRDAGEGGERIRFPSVILPRWARRMRSLDALLPTLYRTRPTRAAS